MHVKLRLSIENKILLPFLVISIITAMAFAAILYYSGYTLKLEKELETAKSLIGYIEADINNLYGYIDEATISKKYLSSPDRNIFIYAHDGQVIKEGRFYEGEEARSFDRILAESSQNKLGWRVCYIIDQSDFTNSLIEEQKYVILATIALMVVIVQASIFIASNISGPIRLLSDACKAISEHPDDTQDTKIQYTDRLDEIGQLAGSFERMLDNIRSYTAEIVKVKQLNESIIENLPIGIVAYDERGHVLCINSKTKSLLAREDYINENGEGLQAVIHRILAHDALLHDPVRLQNAEGRVLDLDVGVWRLAREDQSPWGILCTIDDITYKKMMEEKVSEGEKLAYSRQLTASLAHEIRNPLAGIRASIQVISNRLDHDRDRVLCASIVSEVDRVNLLIGNLLNLSRERHSQKTLLNIGGLYDEILLLYSKVAENNRIALTAETAGTITLYADESEMRQILINLINNSIKAIKNGGAILLGAENRNGETILTVADNGMGMSERELAGVLEPIRSGGSSRRLGLFIVSRLLEQNGGSFSVQSEPGIGTTIVITFRKQG